MLYVDRAITHFWKRLASIIAVKGCHAEQCL